MNRDFITVGEALKLIPPFKGNKQEVLEFVGNVDTALAVINPEQAILYKFVLTCISGEPRTAISHTNLGKWAELKEFLQNSYAEKQTLDYHDSQHQNKTGTAQKEFLHRDAAIRASWVTPAVNATLEARERRG